MSTFDFKDISCPVCDSNQTKFMGWRGGRAHHAGAGVETAIVRCLDCSHQYPNPMPFPTSGGLDDLYVNADEYFRGHSVDAKKELGIRLLTQFEEKLGRKGRFLDVGCAAGEFLWAAKELGWEYEGVDPSTEFIRIGKEKLDVEGKACILQDAEFADDYFDAVTMSSVLEHIYDPYDLLVEIRRVLRPGGYFWFDAPNEDGLYMRAGNFYMKLQRRDWVVSLAPTFPPFHVQGFNPESLKFLTDRVGFEIESLKIFGDVWEFTGEKSLRKKLEFAAARGLTWFSNLIDKGPYMEAWAKKPL